MGFFSRVKDAGGYVINLRVTKWMALDQVKGSYTQLAKITRSIFNPEQAERTETFEQALQRLQLTQAEIDQRQIEFTRLMIIYILVAAGIFAYSVWIAYAFKNIYGFFMGFSITIYGLSLAFKYHFWVYQIKHRKLGCTLREWFLDIR